MQWRHPRKACHVPAATFIGLLLIATSTCAFVCDNDLRWPIGDDGYALIPVCIVEGSSTAQESGNKYLPHEPNPTLEVFLERVRAVLSSGWETHSGVRFVDWRPCAVLSDVERSKSVGLFIHPDAINSSFVGTKAMGKSKGTQFIPWGFGASCIEFSFRSFRYEYKYDCMEQFALHEFGHAIALKHEWLHPLTPESCSSTRNTTEQPLPVNITSPIFGEKDYTVVNTDMYDWYSVMTYDKECANGDGDFYGSQELSPVDILGVKEVYPPPDFSAPTPSPMSQSPFCNLGPHTPIRNWLRDHFSLLGDWFC
jgi:hypothetical protein